MNQTLRRDADRIVTPSIRAVLPDEAAARALQGFDAKTGKGLGGRNQELALGAAVGIAGLKNAAYHALQAVDGLIMTGPTGTNVNDVAVALIKESEK